MTNLWQDAVFKLYNIYNAYIYMIMPEDKQVHFRLNFKSVALYHISTLRGFKGNAIFVD